MFVENIELLKTWLVNYLTPLCEADPQVLSKYCIALVRKDRPCDELKNCMLDQLEVFLKDHTKTFVSTFLDVVKTKSYLGKPTKPQQGVKVATTIPKGTSPDSTSQSATVNQSVPTSVLKETPLVPVGCPVSPTKKEKEEPNKQKREDKDERKSRKRTHSRDSRRSRSGGRSSRIKYDERRKRSPHGKRYRQSRTTTRSRSPGNKEKRSVSPSTKSKRHISRSRSPISNTTEAAKTEHDKNESNDDVSEPTMPSMISVPPPNHGYSKSQRCRDYDEKGFCMRGDQCPFDHGTDPVVLEGASLDFPPPPIVDGATSLSQYTVPPPPVQSNRTVISHISAPSRVSSYGEYTPNNPSLWVEDGSPQSNSGYAGKPSIPARFTVPPPDLGRELINVTVADQTKANKNSLSKRLGPPGKFSNGSFQRRSGDNCTLELRKVPIELNNIALLNNHFAKFGTVINLQVHHEGDSEAALVTFANHAEANAAYRSTEAVLNNRFIKMFWHNQGKEAFHPKTIHDRLSRNHGAKPYGYPRQHDFSKEKVVQSHGTIVKTVYNSDKGDSDKDPMHTAPDSTQSGGGGPTAEEMRKVELETIFKQQELLKAELAAKQKAETKKMEAIKLKNEVELRTSQLYHKQMEQVKILINKLETNQKNMKPNEIKSLMETIKYLQDSANSTKKKLTSLKTVPAAPPVRSKVQLDKEILDTELELYNVQADSQGIGGIKSRLQQLKNQMAAMKMAKAAYAPTIRSVPTRGHSMRGRGRGRGGGVAVDRRTRCINASGFEREDKDDVLAHFSALGNIVNYTWDDQTPSVTVQYGTRREAEKAMIDGRNLADRLLTLTWTRQEITKEERMEKEDKSETEPANADDGEEITEEIVEIVETVDDDDSVIFDDDEEEEEARSWRR